ncbi:MAG: hypothetical protein M1125_02080 [Candidatus Marsarchaeota archaeon]|nr:hypothetical protein [Candidatus Marsarchaeota archaeon]
MMQKKAWIAILAIIVIIIVVAVAYIGIASRPPAPPAPTLKSVYSSYTYAAASLFNVSNASILTITPLNKPADRGNFSRISRYLVNYTENGKSYYLPRWFSFTFPNGSAYLSGMQGSSVKFAFFMNGTDIRTFTQNPASGIPVIFTYYVSSVSQTPGGVFYNFTIAPAGVNSSALIRQPFPKEDAFYTIGFEYGGKVYLVPSYAV